jgi:FMN-dependent NADH-azoreductase
METILHIDSSPRGDLSKSRKLAHDFAFRWKNSHPNDKFIYRDLSRTLIPHITQEWIEATTQSSEYLTSEQSNVLRLSDELVDEFLLADRCIFSVPMYNFSVPSSFKAYIDQIIRFDRTFTVKEGKFSGLTKDKRVLFITARGQDYSAGSPYEAWDCQEPLLRYTFQFMGVTNIQFIHANGLDLEDTSQLQRFREAQFKLQELVENW